MNEFIIAGIGGHGVITCSKIVSTAALQKGYDIRSMFPVCGGINLYGASLYRPHTEAVLRCLELLLSRTFMETQAWHPS